MFGKLMCWLDLHKWLIHPETDTFYEVKECRRCGLIVTSFHAARRGWK